MVEVIDNLMYSIDYILNTKRKRHIIGGILLSLSALFGGLAVTVITIKEEGNREHEN